MFNLSTFKLGFQGGWLPLDEILDVPGVGSPSTWGWVALDLGLVPLDLRLGPLHLGLGPLDRTQIPRLSWLFLCRMVNNGNHALIPRVLFGYEHISTFIVANEQVRTTSVLTSFIGGFDVDFRHCKTAAKDDNY